MKLFIMAIAIIIDLALYTLFLTIWYKSIDKIDEMLKNKLRKKTYDVITLISHVVSVIIIVLYVLN